MTSSTTADPERPLEPLWRGLLVYRVLALLSAGVVVLVGLPQYRSPVGAAAVLLSPRRGYVIAAEGIRFSFT